MTHYRTCVPWDCIFNSSTSLHAWKISLAFTRQFVFLCLVIQSEKAKCGDLVLASVLPLFIRRSCLGLIKREKSLEHSLFMFSLVLQCRLPEGILYTAQNKMCLEPIIVTVLSAPPCRQSRLAISGGSKWLRCSCTIGGHGSEIRGWVLGKPGAGLGWSWPA